MMFAYQKTDGGNITVKGEISLAVIPYVDDKGFLRGCGIWYIFLHVLNYRNFETDANL